MVVSRKRCFSAKGSERSQRRLTGAVLPFFMLYTVVFAALFSARWLAWTRQPKRNPTRPRRRRSRALCPKSPWPILSS